MNSKELFNSFSKKYNFKEFNFVVVSADIKSTHKHRNVYVVKKLLPPTKCLSYIMNGMNGGDFNKYREKYFKYLSEPDAEIYITTLVKLCVAEDTNVVLLCSEDELELYYMKLLTEYIENVYRVKIYPYKKFKKSKKCNSAKNKKKTMMIIQNKMDLIRMSDGVLEPDSEFMASKLNAMKKKELRQLMKNMGIPTKKSESRKKMLKELKMLRNDK
jgi:hypothetical protein